MQIRLDEREGSRVAVVETEEIVIRTAQDAMDLMATVSYEMDGCRKILIPKRALPEDFFDLKMGLAGEILQKFVNYATGLAIVGDFGIYVSQPLKDFIYESNRGNSIFFVATEQDGIDKLAQI